MTRRDLCSILWTFHCKVKVQRMRQSMLASSAKKDSKWKPYSNQCHKCKSETKLLLLLPLALLLLLLLLVLLPLRLRLLLPNHSALLYSPLLSVTPLYSPRLDSNFEHGNEHGSILADLSPFKQSLKLRTPSSSHPCHTKLLFGDLW